MAREIEDQPNIADERTRREAEAFVLYIAKDYNMKVKFGKPGEGSHWDFASNEVVLDPANFKRGVAIHEGAHRGTSRAEHVQDLWPQPGFSFGFNAAEDPRVNQWAMTTYPGESTKEDIKEYIEEDLSEGGGLDYKNIKKDAEDSLGYVPKHMQWGAEMINYWYQKQFTDNLNTPEELDNFLQSIPDEDVRKLVEESIPAFEEYYHDIPLKKDELVVQSHAISSSQTFRDQIWPAYQGLVEKAYQDQSLAQMIQDMLSQDQPQPGQGGSGSSGTPFSSLPQDVQDEIRQKVKENMDKKKKQKQAQQEQQDNSGQKGSSEQAGSEDEQSESEGDSQSGSSSSQDQDQQKQDSQANSTSGVEPQTEEGTQQSPQDMQVPWDKLSDQAKEAVQKAFDSLPKEQQEEYKQQAQQNLEDVEDAANEKLRGQMNDPRYTETNKERRTREEQEQQKSEQQERNEQIIEDMQRNSRKALEQIPENPYQSYLTSPQVAGLIRNQDSQYRKIFQPEEDPNVTYSYSGLSPSMQRALQFQADPRRSNIFVVKGVPMMVSHRSLRLYDVSESMRGIIEEIFQEVVVDTELFNKHGIEDAIYGFTSTFPGNLKEYKTFEQKKLTRPLRDKIGELLDDCLHHGGGTPTRSATQEAYKIIKKRMQRLPMQHNYFITFTDGRPTDSSVEEMAEEIRTIRGDKSLITCGFGIGPGTEFVNSIYPRLPEKIRRDVARVLGKPADEVGNSYPNVVDFARASAIIIGYMVKQPELFN